MFAPNSKPGPAYATGAATIAVKIIAVMNFFINYILQGWIKSDLHGRQSTALKSALPVIFGHGQSKPLFALRVQEAADYVFLKTA